MAKCSSRDTSRPPTAVVVPAVLLYSCHTPLVDQDRPWYRLSVVRMCVCVCDVIYAIQKPVVAQLSSARANACDSCPSYGSVTQPGRFICRLWRKRATSSNNNGDRRTLLLGPDSSTAKRTEGKRTGLTSQHAVRAQSVKSERPLSHSLAPLVDRRHLSRRGVWGRL